MRTERIPKDSPIEPASGCDIDGTVVKRLRVEKLMTQEQLGIKASLSKRTIEKIESKAVARCAMKTVVAIADALGIDHKALLLSKGNQVAATTAPGEGATVAITLTLDCPFDSFTPEDAVKFVETMQHVAKLDCQLIINDISSGSVILTLTMAKHEFSKLVAAAQEGHLPDHPPLISIDSPEIRDAILINAPNELKNSDTGYESDVSNEEFAHQSAVAGMSQTQVFNVFEAILRDGHDEDFRPDYSDEFSATEAPAGSQAKIDELRERVKRGMPLWHDEDRHDYSGLTGVVRPRE